MNLSWKDAVATILVAGAGIVAYAKLKGFDWPLIGSWRMATLVVLALGLGTCIAVGSGIVPTKNGWTTTATILGIAAFILAILGLILGSKLVFLSLLADTAILWAVATIHHIVSAT